MAKQKNESRTTKPNHDVFDDQTIESLMRYYKLDSSDSLLRYIKKHHLTKDNEVEPED